MRPWGPQAHSAYISTALLTAEHPRGPPCSTETDFAASPEAFALSSSIRTCGTSQSIPSKEAALKQASDLYRRQRAELYGIEGPHGQVLPKGEIMRWMSANRCVAHEDEEKRVSGQR